LRGQVFKQFETLALDRSHWPTIKLVGPDSADYLNRISTQKFPIDRRREDSELIPTAFLRANGSLVAWFLVRQMDSGFDLIVPPSFESKVLATLDQYHFSEKVSWRAEASKGSVFEFRYQREKPPIEMLFDCKFAFGNWKSSWQLGGASYESTLSTEQFKFANPEEARAFYLSCGIPDPESNYKEFMAPEVSAFESLCHESKGCYPGQEVIEKVRSYGRRPNVWVPLWTSMEVVFKSYESEVCFEKGKKIGTVQDGALDTFGGTVFLARILSSQLREKDSAPPVRCFLPGFEVEAELLQET